MKKKILILSAVAICFAILASGTIAFFTAEGRARNVITTGAIDIAVEEWQKVGDELLPYPGEPIDVMPGVTVSKIATVKNIEEEAFIRAKLDVVVQEKDGTIMEISSETLNKIISIKMNGEDWLRKDGDSEWWYYGEAVPTGTSTEAFFTEVAFDGPNLTNEYQDCTVEIIVKAQGVQTANNGSSALEAAGWPKE